MRGSDSYEKYTIENEASLHSVRQQREIYREYEKRFKASPGVQRFSSPKNKNLPQKSNPASPVPRLMLKSLIKACPA